MWTVKVCVLLSQVHNKLYNDRILFRIIIIVSFVGNAGLDPDSNPVFPEASLRKIL